MSRSFLSLNKLSINKFLPSLNESLWEKKVLEFIKGIAHYDEIGIYFINKNYHENPFNKEYLFTECNLGTPDSEKYTKNVENLEDALSSQEEELIFTFLGPMIKLDNENFFPVAYVKAVAEKYGYTMTIDKKQEAPRVIFSKNY